jgi:hypothetical protein
MMQRFIVFAFFLMLGMAMFVDIHAQKITYPPGFTQKLDSLRLEFFEPLEAGYKVQNIDSNPFQDCDFAIRSSKEKMEIRYVILPLKEDEASTTLPNVLSFRAMMNVASNTENLLISAIKPPDEQVMKDFNADWGMVYFFVPKPMFANWPFCRMVALHKKERGTVLIFFMFDNPGNPALDNRYLALRFLD